MSPIDYPQNYVTRIHLNTKGDRIALIDFCLKEKEQYIAIGWHKVYTTYLNADESSFNDYMNAIKKYAIEIDHKNEKSYRTNPALSVFKEAKENDLFWTRDCDGFYWICRVIGSVRCYHDEHMDIGAIIPVKAYMFGKEVPGRIKASFTRSAGGTTEKIKDFEMIEFSKYAYNSRSKTEYYKMNMEKQHDSIINLLPDFDLEELVILFIQKEFGYYLLPSSIAKKSTSVKVECEFINNNGNKAVVQVKGGKSIHLNSADLMNYEDNGYNVYLYSQGGVTIADKSHAVEITISQLEKFYEDNIDILPNNLIIWKDIYQL